MSIFIKIIIVIVVVYIIIQGFFISYLIRMNQKEKIKEIENRRNELKNKRYELYSNIDIESAISEIDKLVQRYLNNYIVEHISIQDINYISKEEANDMIKIVTKEIMLEISDLYIFYIKLIISINSDDDLLTFLYKKVREHVLIFMTDFNKVK